GVTVVPRANNGISLYTDSGITLFDGKVRNVSLQTVPLAPGSPGGAVTIDGFPATGAGAAMPISSGKIAGLLQVRDTIAPAFGAQLDDIAATLIRDFAEQDQGSPATYPPAAGLFAASNLSSVPAAGNSVPGLAQAIVVNANVDPAKGGDLMRLRDGGISDPTNAVYNYNSSGASAYTGRVSQLLAMLSAVDTHDPSAGLSGSSSVLDYASSSTGWLQDQRKTTSQNYSYSSALLQRSQDALSRESGVNIDDEMSRLLGLERTYQASAKLISTADSMFNALLQAIG
ncbi:MAG: flagellar hook-associated protein FlgK, partial [Proteobacteria bacterium]|nr:flagellar hook-associated protein FlgK [Pseudomonadota bacterium]